jgi:hypothetical protein
VGGIDTAGPVYELSPSKPAFGEIAMWLALWLTMPLVAAVILYHFELYFFAIASTGFELLLLLQIAFSFSQYRKCKEENKYRVWNKELIEKSKAMELCLLAGAQRQCLKIHYWVASEDSSRIQYVEPYEFFEDKDHNILLYAYEIYPWESWRLLDVSHFITLEITDEEAFLFEPRLPISLASGETKPLTKTLEYSTKKAPEYTDRDEDLHWCGRCSGVTKISAQECRFCHAPITEKDRNWKPKHYKSINGCFGLSIILLLSAGGMLLTGEPIGLLFYGLLAAAFFTAMIRLPAETPRTPRPRKKTPDAN